MDRQTDGQIDSCIAPNIRCGGSTINKIIRKILLKLWQDPLNSARNLTKDKTTESHSEKRYILQYRSLSHG